MQIIRANNILILGRSIVQELNGVTLYAEKMYPTNLKKKKKKTLWPLFMDGVQLPQG